MNAPLPRAGENYRRPLVLFLLLFLLLPAPAAVASSSHYPNGSAGINAGSLPPPGHYAGVMSLHYSADTIKNKRGKTINVDYEMDVFMFAPMYTYSSDIRILGGRYAFSILVPMMHTDFNAGKTFGVQLPNHFGVTDVSFSKNAVQTGLGDVLLAPFMLSWEKERFDITAGLKVFIPTGKYSPKNPASPGRGFWTIAPSLGGTLYFDDEKTWSASALVHYEINTKQDETRRRHGDQAHVEWGVGKRFAQIFKTGFVGYNSWQVSHDSGPGSRSGLSAANGIGPEVGVYIPDLNLDVTLRTYWEYKNRNTAQGTTTVLNLTIPF